uniref:acid-sensing ion channel 5-like n=1 Tax=Styela clava TaxID=7725 RepID=UPI00193A97CF|nr:acid-sensing ion channel 5-like [Styela clava]
MAEKSKTNKEESEYDFEFVSSTTLHGVYFCYVSQSKIAKFFWAILIIGMIGILFWQISIRIREYLEYATSTDISEEFVSYLPFPAVTICSFNRYFVASPNLRTLRAIHTINQMTSSSYMAYAKNNNMKPNISRIDGFGQNFDIKTFTNKRGFSIGGKFMPQCRFKSSDCDLNDFTTIFTTLGKCYTFNEGDYNKTQNIPGSGHGLSVTLDVRQDLYTEQPFLGNSEAGIKLQIHPQHDVPDVETFGVSVPVGTKASIEITRSDYKLMYGPWGQCDPNRENLKYFSTYSLNNCMNECLTDMVVNECGCHLFTQYWAANFSRECTAQDMYDCASAYAVAMQENLSSTDCNCSIPCTYTKYGLTISYSTYPNLPTMESLQTRMTKDKTYVQGNSIQFEIYFNSMSYSTFSQSKKVDESSLISDLGGQLGLWLGMSFITLVEIFQFLGQKAGRTSYRRVSRKVDKSVSA